MIISDGPTFDREELERSIPLDPLRVIVSESGRKLLQTLAEEIDATSPRNRMRRAYDHQRWMHTLNVLVANLVIAAFNRIDPARFVGISFNSNDYTGAEISVTFLARARDGLTALGLVEGRRGYRSTVQGAVRHSRRTRLRATTQLRSRFAALGLNRKHVGWTERRDSIILRMAEQALAPEPPSVTASRPILEGVNQLLRSTSLHLPDDAWARVVKRYHADGSDVEERLISGEEETNLYRIFKGGWDRGGRLYGGWWINLPKLERQNLSINGKAVVERDFARLHPTILFARAGIKLDFDIYSVPGFEGPAARELGKRTFNRLINKTMSAASLLRPTALDREQLPKGRRFADYLEAFVSQLAPVASWFGTGEGLRLQREDSDLAVDILGRLLARDVVVLPVHDSFIVSSADERALVDAMEREFARRYGFYPVIR